MKRLQRSALLPFAARQMYALVNDVERYPEFLPWCENAEILVRKDDEMVARLMKGVQNPGSSQAMPPAGGNPDLTAPQVRGAFRFMRDTLLKSE